MNLGVSYQMNYIHLQMRSTILSRIKNDTADSSGMEVRGMVKVTSLGCAKNFVDTEVASASFLCEGFGLTSSDTDADIQFINTCAFLEDARNEAAKTIRGVRCWKEASPETRRVIVAGCFVEWADAAELGKFPYVDAWMRIDSVADAGKIAVKLLDGVKKIPQKKSRPSYLYTHETPRVQLTPSHYAYIKMADGCDNCCTYCRIPSIRGNLRSRDLKDVVEEARLLVKNGVRELILIAQDSGAFGRDRNGKPCLAELLNELDRIKGDFCLRLMYLHPASVNDELLRAMEKSKHLVRCIEMPLQHIAENVLKAMHRKVFEERTREVVKQMRGIGYAIRTTFMTGFPGETAEDFETLRRFVEETEFERLGVFAYSREAGTPAAELPGQVAPNLAKRRRNQLLKLQRGISLKHNRALIGREIDVIVDEVLSRTKAVGRTLLDAPDIDNLVVVTSGVSLAVGDVVKAKVTDAAEYELGAKAVCEKMRGKCQ